jgi:hypothetical protein
MSSALAYAGAEPYDHAPSHSRHVEIVTTREQKKARPKLRYAVLTLGGLFALFLVQLLLSIVIAGGAYQISDLQVQQRQLEREQDALVETLNLMASPQNVATKAESLGMVLGTSTPAFLRLADGAVVGAERRGSSSGTVLGSKGNLVPNSLLKQLAVAKEQPGIVVAGKGAPNVAPASSSVTSSLDTLPSPVTR